jgi:hypothetical protein
MNAKPVDNLIRDFITQDISAALESFEITKKVEHQGLKGKAREIFVQKLVGEREQVVGDFDAECLGPGSGKDLAAAGQPAP